MRTLEPTTEGFRALLTAWQKARSIAAEGDYADYGAVLVSLGLRDAEWSVHDDRTGDLLVSLINGKRECDWFLWLNIVRMVEASALWCVGLAFNDWELPDHASVLAQARA